VASLFRQKIVQYTLPDGSYRTPDGRRVTKDTPGAIRTETRSKKWYGRYTDARGQQHRVPLSESKEVARRMLAKRAGDAQLAGAGLADPFAEHRDRPLIEHLADFGRYLAAKGNTPEHVQKTLGHARAVVTGCRFQVPGDLQPSAVVEFLADLRKPGVAPELEPGLEWFEAPEAATLLGVGLPSLRTRCRVGPLEGPPPLRKRGRHLRLHRDTLAAMLRKKARGLGVRTSNDYLRAVKQFSKWLVKDGRAPVDPLAHLSRLNTKTDVRHRRRALPSGDFGAFCETVAGQGPFRKLAGADRVALYTLSLYTGLRASELASLTPASFDLDAEPPTVTVAAAFSKHRREDVQPLRRDTAEMMRGYLAGRPRHLPVWPGSWFEVGAEMLRRDLAAAGIPYRDEAGEVLDFHGLRHTFISALASSGVHPKVAQVLARHQSITLTMDYYTHLTRVDVARDLERLPGPEAKAEGKPSEQKKRRGA
jgi:integrase